jgi:hypothetical protein
METLSERATRALLMGMGLATALCIPSLAPAGANPVPVLYHQYVVGLLALALVAAAFLPAIRLAVVGTGVLVKAGFVAIAVAMPEAPALAAEWALLAGLLGTGALLLREWLREARWDGAWRGRMGA